MPEFWARSSVGSMQEATTHWCFSPSFSASLPLLLNYIKSLIFKKIFFNKWEYGNVSPNVFPFFMQAGRQPSFMVLGIRNSLKQEHFNLCSYETCWQCGSTGNMLPCGREGVFKPFSLTFLVVLTFLNVFMKVCPCTKSPFLHQIQ